MQGPFTQVFGGRGAFRGQAAAPSDNFATELALSPFTADATGAAPIFSGRRDTNSGLIWLEGTGQADAVIQARMTAVLDLFAAIPAGETLAEYHTAMLSATSPVVGRRGDPAGLKSSTVWLGETAGVSASTSGGETRIIFPSSGTLVVKDVAFEQEEYFTLISGSASIYFINCKFGTGRASSTSVQFNVRDAYNVTWINCDFEGPGDGSGSGTVITHNPGSTGKVRVIGCRFWGHQGDVAKPLADTGDEYIGNVFDAPTQRPGDIEEHIAAKAYALGAYVVEPGDDPEFEAFMYVNQLAGNTATPDFASAVGATVNNWLKINPHSDCITIRGSGAAIIAGNIFNGDHDRRIFASTYFGPVNSNIFSDAGIDLTGTLIYGNLVMRNPNQPGGNPLGLLNNASIYGNRIETRDNTVGGYWKGVASGVKVFVEDNVNALDESPLGLLNGTTDLVEGTDVTTTTLYDAVTGDTLKALDGEEMAWLYQGSYATLATADGSGNFGAYFAGPPRSHYPYKASVRYRDAANTPATTSNHCFVGWVMASFSQSDYRFFGDGNFEGVSLTPTVATPGINVRVISLDRNPDVAPVTAAELYVWDITGSPPAGRDPVWRFGNTLAELLSDGPIVVMAHQESGSSDKQTVDDNDDGRFWEDELLIAQAGQPHLVEGSRRVALDLVYWSYSSSGNYENTTLALGVTGRVAFDVAPDGTPVERGTLQVAGGVSWTQHHSWADIYDWTHTRLAFKEHANVNVTNAQEAFIGHPVYGQYVIGFPAAFSTYWLTNGTRPPGGGAWFDGGHPSTNQVGGSSEVAALAALGMARAVGVYDPGPFVLNYIDWPTGAGDDKKWVHVGIEGRDLTTLQTMFEAMETPPDIASLPSVLGGVLGFTVNGTRTTNTSIALHEGFLRARIGKQDGSDWTGADTLGYDPVTINYQGLSVPVPDGLDAYHDTLDRWRKYPIVATGLATKEGAPVADRVAAGLFAVNPLPAPAGPQPQVVHTSNPATARAVSAGGSALIAQIPSDGRPLSILVVTQSTSAAGGSTGAPTGMTLDVAGAPTPASIMPNTVRGNNGALKMDHFYVAAPAGTPEDPVLLDLVATYAVAAVHVGVIAIAYDNTDGLGAAEQHFGGNPWSPGSPTAPGSAGNSLMVMFSATQGGSGTMNITSGGGAWLMPDWLHIGPGALFRVRAATQKVNTGVSPNTVFTSDPAARASLLTVEMLDQT